MVRIRLAAEESIDWNKIPALELENVLWTPDAGIRAKAQICRTEDALRVHMTAAEKEIRAEYPFPSPPSTRTAAWSSSLSRRAKAAI